MRDHSWPSPPRCARCVRTRQVARQIAHSSSLPLNAPLVLGMAGCAAEECTKSPQNEELRHEPSCTVSVVSTTSGKVLVPALHLDSDCTVGDLRARIFRECAMPWDAAVRLFHRGAELAQEADGVFLPDSGIADGAILAVAVVPRPLCATCVRTCDSECDRCSRFTCTTCIWDKGGWCRACDQWLCPRCASRRVQSDHACGHGRD